MKHLENKWWVLIGVSICSFIAFMDFTIVNTALPAIQNSLSLSMLELQWMMNSFLLTYCLFLASMGRISDLYGHKLVLYTGVILFSIASLIAGFAENSTILIIARALQGFGEAMIIPAALASIIDHFPQEEHGRAIGIWSSIGGLGSVAGPVLGGFIISLTSWRMIFWLVVPIAMIGLLICFRSIQSEKKPQSVLHVDYLGWTLLTISLLSLVLPLMQGSSWGWQSPLVIGLFILSAIGFVLFYRFERKISEPLISFELLFNKIFAASSIAQFSFVFFNSAALFFMPLFLERIRHEAPYVIGLMLMPVPLMVVLFSSFAGKMVDRRGVVLPILIGLGFFILSGIMQSQFTETSPTIFILFSFLAMGLGWAFTMGPSATAATGSVPARFAGLATGALWTIQVIGGVMGLTLGGIFFRHMHLAEQFLTAYHASFWFLTIVLILAWISVYSLLGKLHRK